MPDITFSAPVGGYVVNETFSITFTCIAGGIPQPLIQWFRGDLLLDPVVNTSLSPQFELGDANATIPLRAVSVVTRMLTLNNAMGSDSGTYTCEATNDAMNGIDRENFEVFVQSKLYITCIPHCIISLLVFTCSPCHYYQLCPYPASLTIMQCFLLVQKFQYHQQ